MRPVALFSACALFLGCTVISDFGRERPEGLGGTDDAELVDAGADGEPADSAMTDTGVDMQPDATPADGALDGPSYRRRD